MPRWFRTALARGAFSTAIRSARHSFSDPTKPLKYVTPFATTAPSKARKAPLTAHVVHQCKALGAIIDNGIPTRTSTFRAVLCAVDKIPFGDDADDVVFRVDNRYRARFAAPEQSGDPVDGRVLCARETVCGQNSCGFHNSLPSSFRTYFAATTHGSKWPTPAIRRARCRTPT